MNDLFNETSCPCCGRAYETAAPGFKAFWEKVPHKIAKANAEKAWKRMSNADRVEADKRVQSFYALFAKTYPTASPLHVATYLNNRRWEDDGVNVDVSKSDTQATIAKMMQSENPAVRDYAERLSVKHGFPPKRMGDA